MKKLLLSVTVVFSVILVSCKKDNPTKLSDNDVSKFPIETSQKKISSLIKAFNAEKKLNIQSTVLYSDQYNTNMDNFFKRYISDSVSKNLLSSVYETEKTKFLTSDFPTTFTQINEHAIQSIKKTNVDDGDDSYQFNDIPGVAQVFTNSLISINALSPAVIAELNNLSGDLNSAAQSYLQLRYGQDSTNTELGDPTIFYNMLSNVILSHTGYGYTLNMTDNERYAYSLALFSLNDNMFNQTLSGQAGQVAQAWSITKKATNTKTIINGFGSWLKKNLIKPVVTFVVQVVVAAAVVVGCIMVGSLIAGPDGAIAGFAAGLFIWDSLVKKPVNQFLQHIGLYSPDPGDPGYPAQDY